MQGPAHLSRATLLQTSRGERRRRMDIAFPMKPNVAAPVDYSKRRHQPEKDDLELSPAGEALLAYIEESARPKEVAAAFPRILNRMAKLWKMPREMDRYFEELLADTRGNRKGFPLNILMELSTPRDYYKAKAFPNAPRHVPDRQIGYGA